MRQPGAQPRQEATEPLRCCDVSADGQRFYVTLARPAPPSPPVTHVDLTLNWVEEVKVKVGK